MKAEIPTSICKEAEGERQLGYKRKSKFRMAGGVGCKLQGWQRRLEIQAGAKLMTLSSFIQRTVESHRII